jgi:hypothetical protein
VYITKSDITSTRDCDTKLYYRKKRYPSLLKDDPYLAFLADGGYMVEKMARLLFPDGLEVEGKDDIGISAQTTRQILEAGDATLFEATIIHPPFLARIDILRRVGTELWMIEVKSSSIVTSDEKPPFRGQRGKIESSWLPYLEDVTFQFMVLSRAYPAWKIIPCLCVVDKARSATENSTYNMFKLSDMKGALTTSRPDVVYLGRLDGMINEHVLAIERVDEEVHELMDEVRGRAERLAGSLQQGSLRKIATDLGVKCKKCEFRTKSAPGKPDGFAECWGKLCKSDPHILDLYRIDLLGGKNSDFVRDMADRGQACLTDIPDSILKGKSAIRQKIQIEYTKLNKEYIDPELPRFLKGQSYPLHFIDFEASRLALPYHAGMHPYEIAAFQWSCHSIQGKSGAVVHHEWLNDADAFPNFEFARSLRQVLGDKGTIYTWSPYERTTLKSILSQMQEYGEMDSDLTDWLATISDPRCNRVVDLYDLAKRYYFHPLMKGRLSIKYVLPAIWNLNESLRKDPLFAGYEAYDDDGALKNPYDVLPVLPIGESEEVVKEGTGAMRVYQEMMYGLAGQNPEKRQSYRKLLLQYCRLDTLAMVIIWKHWTK